VKGDANGNCFEVAAHILMAQSLCNDTTAGVLMLEACEEDLTDLCVCHGMVTRATDGYRHIHAWMEFNIKGNPFVIDFANGMRFFGPVEAYRWMGEITEEETVHYNLKDLKECLIVHETYGPWD
jgi:hypothetical protein